MRGRGEWRYDTSGAATELLGEVMKESGKGDCKLVGVIDGGGKERGNKGLCIQD